MFGDKKSEKTFLDKISGGYLVLFIFAASFMMFAIGINNFIEDTLSSRFGLEQLQMRFGVVPVTLDYSWWAMSIAPQIASIVFFYLYFIDEKKSWINRIFNGNLTIALIAQAIDIYSDSWYRSGQQLFQDASATTIAFALTLIFFTFGSELFIAYGFRLVTSLFTTSLLKTLDLMLDIGNSFKLMKRRIEEFKSKTLQSSPRPLTQGRSPSYASSSISRPTPNISKLNGQFSPTRGSNSERQSSSRLDSDKSYSITGGRGSVISEDEHDF